MLENAYTYISCCLFLSISPNFSSEATVLTWTLPLTLSLTCNWTLFRFGQLPQSSFLSPGSVPCWRPKWHSVNWNSARLKDTMCSHILHVLQKMTWHTKVTHSTSVTSGRLFSIPPPRDAEMSLPAIQYHESHTCCKFCSIPMFS